MNRFVFPLAMLLLVELICSAINKALAPYEAAFWTWGGYASLAFIGFLWGLGLDERLHRMEHPRSTDRGRRGSAPSGGARSRR